MPVDLVQKRIGKTAMHVLRVLWYWRDAKTGHVTATRHQISETKSFAKTTPRRVRRALQRLTEAGFVEGPGLTPDGRPNGLGNRLVSSWDGLDNRVAKVWRRRVYGAEVEAVRVGEGRSVLVPEPVFAYLTACKRDARRGGGAGRGGHLYGNQNRSGAGEQYAERKNRALVLRTLEAVRSGRAKVPTSGAMTELPIAMTATSSGAMTATKKGSDRDSLDGAGTSLDGAGNFTGWGHIDLLVSYRDLSLSTKEKGAPCALEFSRPAVSPEPESKHPDAPTPKGRTTVDRSAFRISGTPTQRKPRAALGQRIPGVPGWPRIQNATVPRPRPLSDEISDERGAVIVASLYGGACEAITGKPCWVAKPAQLMRSRNYRVVLDAVRFMRENDIPPAAWIMLSFAAWRHIANTRTKPPTMGWVFSVKRLERDTGWRAYEDAGGNDLWGPLEKSVVHRYARMLDAIDRDGNYEDASKVVARFFPEGFDEAVAAANKAAKETQTVIDKKVAAGGWAWGR